MLVIRLARHGRKNHPTYRVVLQEKDWSPLSKVIEILGNMNPHTNPRTIVLKKDRISYWLSQGAEPSPTMRNLLIDEGMVKGKKVRTVFGKQPEKTEVAKTETAAPAETVKSAEAAA
ncbi:MAG: Ribosomal protein S16 [uncultured bacterium]|nr:MAG: Ribosomal protein S16 [uncultured bacterium]